MGGGGGGEAPTPAKGKGRRGMKKTKVEIIPMIDTMFFLLVFFILSSVGVIKLQGINITLPKEAPPTTSNVKPPPNKEIMVVIDRNKNEFVNNMPVGRRGDTKPLIRREIQKLYGSNPDMNQVSVVISADPTVPHGQVVSCIDDARALNITKFAIATREDNGR